MVNPPITNTAVSGMPGSQAGVAAAIASTSRQVGMTLGVAVIGAIAGGTISGAIGPSFAAATHAGWWVIAGLGGVCLIVGLLTTTEWARTHRPPHRRAVPRRRRRAGATASASSRRDSGSPNSRLIGGPPRAMMRMSLGGPSRRSIFQEVEMPPVSHQTIKLSRGRHSSPEHGACVMELASMLAGEGFTDHPRSVSRPIASFLRGYNDLVDDRRRADLYGYASQTVGTATSRAVEEARAARLLEWGDALWERRSSRSVFDRMRMRRVAQGALARPRAGRHLRGPCDRQVNDESHAAALALVDELIAMGTGPWEEPAGQTDLATTAGQ